MAGEHHLARRLVSKRIHAFIRSNTDVSLGSDYLCDA